MSVLIWVSGSVYSNTKTKCLKNQAQAFMYMMIKESVYVRERKTVIEKSYFPWVYL